MTSTSPVKAQSVPTDQTEHFYLYEPRPLPVGRWITNLGLSMTLLPEPLVEQEIPAPAIDLQVKYGLLPDISAYASLSTNYFTNVLMTGLQYNNSSGPLSFAAGSALGLFAGFLSVEGQFDNNSAAAIAYVPVLRIGYTFNTFALSLTTSATFLLHADTKVGSIEDQGLEYQFNDFYITLAFEQPFFKNTLVSTGISVAYSRTPYQSWMLFNTFDQFLMLPEFFFSVQL